MFARSTNTSGIILTFLIMTLVAFLAPLVCTLANTAPSMKILDPDGINDIAYDTYTIRWEDEDPDNLAQINLFYTLTADDQASATPIIYALSEESTEDSYTWRTDMTTPGSYYIRGVIFDGVNDPVTVHSPGKLTIVDDPSAPFIILHQPDGTDDVSRDTYRITWSDFDADSNATISLYMDSDSEGFNGVSIVSGISEDSPDNFYDWQVQTIPSGTYWIYAVIDDGIHIPRRIYSPGPLNVNGGPSITITSPDGVDDWATDLLTITWEDSDPDSDASISLFYDTDSSGGDGIPIVSGLSEDSATNSYQWSTTLVPSGKYWIYAVISDGLNPPVTSYSRGPAVIDRRGSIRYLRVTNLNTAWATISWSDDLKGSGKVEYGTTRDLDSSLSDGPATDHFITLNSLLPGTTYYYRVSTTGSGSTEIHDNGSSLFSFKTLNELPQSSNSAFSGRLTDQSSNSLAAVPVFLWVERATLTDDPFPYTIISRVISTVSSQTGDFSLNTVNLVSTSEQSITLQEGDRIVISARSGQYGQAFTTLTWSSSLVTTGLTLTLPGEDDYLVMDLNLRRGFNMINIPATGASALDSVWLLGKSTNLVAAYRFNRSTQTYQTCFRWGDSFYGSFPLDPDEAVFVKALDSVTIPVSVKGRVTHPRALSLERGFNLMALSWHEDSPLNPSTNYTTYRLLGESSTLLSTYLWSSEKGKYLVTFQLSPGNFLGDNPELKAGQGLFIKSLSTTLITPTR